MRRARVLVAALALAGGLASGVTTAGIAAASPNPSCVAQGVAALPPGAVGPAISDFARHYRPLGQIVASEATSPKDDCPPE